jgi:hypothetical protein
MSVSDLSSVVEAPWLITARDQCALRVKVSRPRQFSTDHLERLNRDERFGFGTFGVKNVRSSENNILITMPKNRE